MTTTPGGPVPDDAHAGDADHDDAEHPDAARPQSAGAPGVEIGMSSDGSTFEPEEDEDAGA